MSEECSTSLNVHDMAQPDNEKLDLHKSEHLVMCEIVKMWRVE